MSSHGVGLLWTLEILIERTLRCHLVQPEHPKCSWDGHCLLLNYLMLVKLREKEQCFSYNVTSPWSNDITAQSPAACEMLLTPLEQNTWTLDVV